VEDKGAGNDLQRLWAKLLHNTKEKYETANITRGGIKKED